MKNNKVITFLVLCLMAVNSSFISGERLPVRLNTLSNIKWMSWKEGIELNKKNPKKLLVFIYTAWDGWSKRMDTTMFDSKISSYLTKNFYCIKLNAETREEIEYDGHTFKFFQPTDSTGHKVGRGIHELPHALLDGRLGFPSLVYFSEQMERIMISPGLKEPNELLTELKYVVGNTYLTQSFEDYQKKKENP